MRLISSVSALSFAAVAWTCGLHGRDTFDTDPQFAPLPATAIGLPIDSKGYAVQDFGGGAYMVTEGSYQGMYHLLPNGLR